MEQSSNIQPQPHANVHEFLKALDDPSNITEEQITKLVNEKLKPGYLSSLTSSTQDMIYQSAKTLMKDVRKMSSMSDAKKEIAGAIKGLNILIKYQKYEKKEKAIKDNIRELSQYEHQINDIALIHEALNLDKELKNPLLEPAKKSEKDFLTDFGAFRNLFGRNRRLDPLYVQHFIKAWNHGGIRNALSEFIQESAQVRKENLSLLDQGKIPSNKYKYNENLGTLHINFIKTAEKHLGDNLKIIKLLVDDIYNNRCSVTNTQFHTDGLFLAFNSEDMSTHSVRQRKTYDEEIQTLREKIKEYDNSKGKSNEQKVIEDRLDLLENQFKPRPGGLYYHLFKWDPIIGPNDPIQPVKRHLGFALEGGKRNISITQLDFTKILGKDNLDLNIEERNLLSKLLTACQRVYLDVDVDKLQNSKNLSKDIKEELEKLEKKVVVEVLEEFNNPSLPLLNKLNAEQKNELVRTALIFTKDVNFNIARDQLIL